MNLQNVLGLVLLGLVESAWAAKPAVPVPVEVSSGWKLIEAVKVSGGGEAVSSAKYAAKDWYGATVPGTVLTSLVNDGIYAEPLYGENERPDKIPETLCHQDYWYRASIKVPKAYKGRHVWLNFAGINFAAEVWVNGKQVGSIKGAFSRGTFDISPLVMPGQDAVIAVMISPQPHPGVPHEHTVKDGVGLNGGITAIDGPTFLSTIGWDWLEAVRDRDTGIWQKVTLSASGPVVVKDPLVTTDLPLPDTSSSDVTVQARLENVSDELQKGVLKGGFGDVTFAKEVEIAPHSSQVVSLDPKTTPALHVEHPRLWWPNGYGPANLYAMHLAFEVEGKVSDVQDFSFGVRKITYAVPDSEYLTISVNGVRVFVRGGNWGLDEAMKRIPRERLSAQIRMHQQANMNLIRNWVGQSTGEDFYELCDKYGILLWDEFFQPNPGDGPNVTDLDTYMANVREKVLRFRNHPSIAVWCARNEGYPPKEIDSALRVLLGELEPTRLYQANSADGRGVSSHGPYHWRVPRDFYTFSEAFKTEVGSMSVPTLESIQGMMPQKDWETINDDWAQHDFAKGAQGGDTYKDMIEARYGKVANLADFTRKAQLANYEVFRAMYEGRNSKLFTTTTGVITWMSNPAQPSFVWQIYHHDLEANASLFAVKKAGEAVHVQMNEGNGHVEVINNLPVELAGATVHVSVYDLDGSMQYEHDLAAAAPASKAVDLGEIAWPATLSPVHFARLELKDAKGLMLSSNLYWRALPERQDDLRDLASMPVVKLEAKVARHDAGGKVMLIVSLHNPTSHVALMAHLQMHRKGTGERVLPVFYGDNYVSLAPNETREITIEADTAQMKGQVPLVLVDGWNVDVTSVSAPDAAIGLNTNAQVNHWPVTGLPQQAP